MSYLTRDGRDMRREFQAEEIAYAKALRAIRDHSVKARGQRAPGGVGEGKVEEKA